MNTHDEDRQDEPRSAGRFRIYLGAAAGVGKSVGGDALLRRAARIAARVRAPLDVVHVTAADRGPADEQASGPLRTLAADLGARWHDVQDDDPVRASARFARQRQITQIVIRSSQRSRWQQLISGGSNVLRLIREAGAVGIDVHVIARREGRPGGILGADEPAAAELDREAPR
ncbi:MAG TPA: universal stress protein [Streptosporangiaceae bacterium]|nr:universal stress protein [Streptosporangiaceae bacterium]